MKPRDPIEALSNDTHGGTMMSDRAYARTFGLEAYHKMKRQEQQLPECPACGPDCTNRTHDRMFRIQGY